MIPSNHLILCHPLLLLPSIFPSITVFFNELALSIRWPKYWSFSISPSNEYSRFISFRMDWLDLLAVQGTLKSLLQHHSSKASILWRSAFLMVQLSHLCMTTGKTMQGKKESEAAQSCLTLCDPMDYSLPGFSIHGIFQARVLEWVAISFFRGSSRPRDQTWVSLIVGRCFYCLSHQGSQKNHSFDYMDLCRPSDVSTF